MAGVSQAQQWLVTSLPVPGLRQGSYEGPILAASVCIPCCDATSGPTGGIFVPAFKPLSVNTKSFLKKSVLLFF